MNLYVLRHGETNYNAEGRFQGRTNVDLNENGINQALNAKNNLKNIKFNIIISSPLNRSIQTTKIVTNVNPQIDDRIIERSFGKLEGKYCISDYEEKSKEYNIESYEQLCERIYGFLNDIIKKYKHKKSYNILIGTHACVAQIIESYFDKNINKENWKNFYLKNAEYKKYELGE